MNAFWNQYQQNQVTTSTPEQILIMLYDGAIRFTGQAMEAIANQDRVRKAESISRAMAIVCTLSDTLDHEIGGEIADNLDALYNFMIRELTNANLNNDPAHLQTVENLLVDLRQTWQEAIQLRNQEHSKQQVEESRTTPAGTRASAL